MSLDTLVCKAVASRPIGTPRARSPQRVIYAFFMRAAENPVGYYGGARCVSLEERQNLLTDGRVIAYVRLALGEPALENIRFVPLGQEDADNDLGGQLVIGPVEGHNGNWVASKPGAGLFAQPRSGGPCLVAEPFPFLHQCNIRPVPTGCRKSAIASKTESGSSDPGKEPVVRANEFWL